jgi:O-antigen/teichoic acid export membrane protein
LGATAAPSAIPGAPKASGSVLTGAGMMLASRMTVAVLGWIGTILIARSLSEEDWGAYSLIFSIIGIVGLVADLQTSRVVMIDILAVNDDREKMSRVVGKYLTMRFALATTCYLISLGIVVLLRSNDPSQYPVGIVVGTAVAGISFFLASTTWGLVTVCQIRMWLRPVAVALALGQVVQLVVTIVLYETHRGTIVRYTIPAVLFDLTAMVFLLVAVRPIVKVRPSIDLSRWWVWIKAAVPLALGGSLGTLYFRIDTIMLSRLDSLSAVGRYQYGYKFSDLLAFVASSLLGLVLPLLVRAWPTHLEYFHKVFRQAFLLLVIAGVAAAVAFAVVAENALVSLFHAPPSAALPARVLVLGQALNFLTQLCAMTLIATGKHRIYPWASFAGLVTNVALNLILIPHYSATGSGLATVLTELIVIAIMASVVVRIHGVRPFPWRSVLIVLVAAGVMALAMVWVQRALTWPVALLAGVPVYLLVLHVLRVDGPGGLRKVVRDSRVDLAPSSSPAG